MPGQWLPARPGQHRAGSGRGAGTAARQRQQPVVQGRLQVRTRLLRGSAESLLPGKRDEKRLHHCDRLPSGDARRGAAAQSERLDRRLRRRPARSGVQAISMLIAAAELAALIDAGGPVTILDVRWRLDEPDGRPTYLQGHVPGAVYVSLEDELSDHSVTGRGRHPLPSGRSVQAAARRWGVRAGVPTVVYDDWNRAGSARAWWVLTAAGIADVRILDGGVDAWRSGGGSLATGAVDPAPGDATVTHD